MYFKSHRLNFDIINLRSRRLEVVGTRKNGRARRRHARGEVLACLPRSRRLSLSPTSYLQAPASQAII